MKFSWSLYMHCSLYIHILTIEGLSQALFEHTPWGGSSLEPNQRGQHLHAKPIYMPWHIKVLTIEKSTRMKNRYRTTSQNLDDSWLTHSMEWIRQSRNKPAELTLLHAKNLYMPWHINILTIKKSTRTTNIYRTTSENLDDSSKNTKTAN